MSSSRFYDSRQVNKAYFGKKAADLVDLIALQAAVVYQQRGMVFPVVTSSTLDYLARHDGVSAADVAQALEHPHQLITQRIAGLEKLHLVERHTDPDDGRRLLVRLTPKGRKQAELLEDYIAASTKAVDDLFAEIDSDLSAVIDRAILALKQRPFSDRF